MPDFTFSSDTAEHLTAFVDTLIVELQNHEAKAASIRLTLKTLQKRLGLPRTAAPTPRARRTRRRAGAPAPLIDVTDYREPAPEASAHDGRPAGLAGPS